MVPNFLSRRGVLSGAAAVLAAATARARAAAADLGHLAQDAAIWGMPLVQTGRYLKMSRAQGIAFNQFYLNPALATPSLKLAGPNVDTIYGFGWLDLSAGPIVLDVPDAADRYYAIQFIDAYQNVFAYVGRRATGTQAGTYVIATTGWRGAQPAGAHRIDAPTSLVLVLTRTLVRGPADLSAAQHLQLGYTLAKLADYPAARTSGIVKADVLSLFPVLDLAADATAYFGDLDDLVHRYPPRGPDAAAARAFWPLKLGRGFGTHRPIGAEAMQAALHGALARVKACKTTDDDDGWQVNYHIRPHNTDPVVRAAINLIGPGAHIAQEALYFGATADVDGAKLDGAHRYTITFPKGGLPPAQAFWSLILYGADFLLYANPIDRYTINDRTTGLVYAADGSLPIAIQHDRPSGDVNWLPAPTGPFRLILRTYQPDPTLLDGHYKVPPVVKTV